MKENEENESKVPRRRSIQKRLFDREEVERLAESGIITTEKDPRLTIADTVN